MQGIILAAGMGKRLGEFTKDRTKCMVEVQGVTLIERMLRQLESVGISRIILVTGYEGAELQRFVQGLGLSVEILFFHNAEYEKTNNIHSLFLVRDFLLKEETLLLESDLIFQDEVLEKLVKAEKGSYVLVDSFRSWMDGTCVTLDSLGNIEGFVTKREFRFDQVENYFKTVNIYRFEKEFSEKYYVPFLEAYCHALGENEYYEQVLKVITFLETPGIKAIQLTGEAWYEIDDPADLDVAESIFAFGEEKLKRFSRRYGGYWRYPALLDFCYLVNPTFPPMKLLDEMKANFLPLISNYPSGSDVLSILAGNIYQLRPEEIVVGNGAAEIIRALFHVIEGPGGVALPTFQEYVSEMGTDQLIPYDTAAQNYHYEAEDLIRYYDGLFLDGKAIRYLVLVNPDNPSGNQIMADGVEKLIEWTRFRQIRLIIDESFLDFSADSEEISLLKGELLRAERHVSVIKSISKSHGVPGLRLGILATGDLEIIDRMRKALPIWNINSLGEFYLQIFMKYKQEYAAAQKVFHRIRENFFRELQSIPGITILPSQANFFMIRLPEGHFSKDFTEFLLNEKRILVKDLSTKQGVDGEWIRVSVKSPEENQLFLEAFQDFFENR